MALPKLLNLEQVAAALCVHYTTAWALVAHGTIRGIRIGRSWRVDEKDLEAYLQAAKQKQIPVAPLKLPSPPPKFPSRPRRPMTKVSDGFEIPLPRSCIQ